MFKPLGIISLLEILPVMGSAAFLPGEGAGDDGLRDIEEGLELEGLYEIRIKHPPFVLHCDGNGAMDQGSECRDRNRHGLVSSNEAQIEAHHLAEFFPNLPGSDRSLLCQQPLNATLFGCKLVSREDLWRDSSRIFSRSNSCAPAEHNCLKE